jgi:hypothetical protein
MANSTLNMIPGVPSPSDLNKQRKLDMKAIYKLAPSNPERIMRAMRFTATGGGRWSNGNYTESDSSYEARMKEQKTTLPHLK